MLRSWLLSDSRSFELRPHLRVLLFDLCFCISVIIFLNKRTKACLFIFQQFSSLKGRFHIQWPSQKGCFSIWWEPSPFCHEYLLSFPPVILVLFGLPPRVAVLFFSLSTQSISCLSRMQFPLEPKHHSFHKAWYASLVSIDLLQPVNMALHHSLAGIVTFQTSCSL